MDYYSSIKTWAEDERPREKMLLKGKNALSDAEVIAILLGSGTVSRSAIDVAKDLMKQSNGSLDEFGKMTINDFKKIKGVGQAKAIVLSAAIELGNRRLQVSKGEKVKVTSSQVAFEQLKYDFMDLQHEEFFVLFLNRGNVVINKLQLSKGGMAGTVVDGKIIFKHALDNNASGIILAHNHPSGRLVPSEADKRLTKQLKDFGKFIEIEVLDHLIICDHEYISFADEGYL